MAMTVIGGVTGNKTLTKIGGAMSLIGGVGGMIAGAAGGASAGAAAAEGLGEAATAGALESATAEAAAAFGGDAAVNAMTDQVVGEMAGHAAATMPDLAMAPMAEAAPAAMPAEPIAREGIIGEAATEGLPGAPGPTAPQGATAPEGPMGPSNPTDGRLSAGTQSSPMNAPAESGSFWTRMTDFANKNGKLLGMGMQLAGGALNGANQQRMWDQKMAMERDKAARANSVGNFAPRGIVNGARA